QPAQPQAAVLHRPTDERRRHFPRCARDAARVPLVGDLPPQRRAGLLPQPPPPPALRQPRLGTADRPGPPRGPRPVLQAGQPRCPPQPLGGGARPRPVPAARRAAGPPRPRPPPHPARRRRPLVGRRVLPAVRRARRPRLLRQDHPRGRGGNRRAPPLAPPRRATPPPPVP